MKHVSFALVTIAIAGGIGLGASAARADLIYDNGPVGAGLAGGLPDYSGFSVSDSFTVASVTNLTSVQIGMETLPNTFATSVDWSIGTSPFDNSIASQAGASVSSVYQFYEGQGYYLYESNFAINGTVGPGTYYLTLQNLFAGGGPTDWGVSNGPSAAYFNPGAVAQPSESFQIYGTPVAGASLTPEPGTFTLVGSLGLTGIGFMRRRNRSK